MYESFLAADTAVLDSVYSLKCGFLDAVMPFFSRLADKGFIWILLALGLMCFKKTRKAGFAAAVALVLGVFFGNMIIKPLVARVRPFMLNPSVELLVDAAKLSDGSFPSGHALASFEGAVVCLYYFKAKGIPAAVLALIISFSRMYLYVHYPSDVLVGALMGTAFAFIGCFAAEFAFKKYEEYKANKAPQA